MRPATLLIRHIQSFKEALDNSQNPLFFRKRPEFWYLKRRIQLRETFLRHLDTMNVNHNSLFPDISGAAEYANRSLERECTDLLWRARPSSIKRLLSNDAYHGDESD